MILNRITQQQHSHKKPTFLFRNERLRFDCKNPLLRVFLRRRKLLYASSSTYSLSLSLFASVRACLSVRVSTTVSSVSMLGY